ncbi:brain-enriched guanylate kinase-associated protein isoform X2 [Erinaceus europaeus]|uniref:Brain-enriched guanylate kinase-associated protein isoform X2 n=2 Tax=Erinaceus europaeus TaxID=9365 RepID=A0ABM3WKE3_ERIEU|nr:brain-enriched guanylate kinase-associated protein isoform X2 [Erinaceus europaeus]
MWTGGRRPGRLRRAASAADMEKLSALQEQKGELRKRLSYTTHKLERLETEFDSTRHYLEIELRRAQEELEKVTEKLRRIQSNYMALQRINQELEDKLYRMGQHYEEEKRALSHEIVALNSHLLEAKVTIDKLSEDNALYRKDCSLAAQLLHCSQSYGRAHAAAAELSPDFQGRGLRLDARGCSLPSPRCGPEPASLPPAAGEPRCSDTALYCPRDGGPGRRASDDAPSSDLGFPPAASSDSADDDGDDGDEGGGGGGGAGPGAAGGFAGYGSLPTSSSYSSFSATSEEREQARAATLTASQQALCRAAYPGPPAPLAAPRQALLPPGPWGAPAGGRWRPLSLDGAAAYPFAGLPGRFRGAPASPPPYARYRRDSCSDGDDPAAEPRFLGLSPGRPDGAAGSPEPPRDSARASPEPRARRSPQAGPRTAGAGLSRKDSLTRAQLYGTLLN